MDFNQPGTASGDRIDMKAHIDRLLMIYPKEVKPETPTVQGPREALVADVVILDGPMAGTMAHDVFLFQNVLIAQLKQFIGNPNPALGRLTYGDPKPGQNPPYKLADYVKGVDDVTASQWINSHPRGFNSPAPAQQHVLPNNGYTQPPVDHQAAAAAQALAQQQAAAAAQAANTQATPPPGVNPHTGEIPPAAPGLNIDTIRTFLKLAVPDQVIAENTGATLEQINAIRNLPVS